jgi:predicted HAD superfamily Cof-like phosphohydrolase
MSGLNKSFEDVKQFHKAFAHPAPDSPTPQSDLDIIYFAVGGLVELGIKPEALWNIVQNANMAKLHDGKAVYHPDGKVKKPDDWQEPEPLLRAEVERQISK